MPLSAKGCRPIRPRFVFPGVAGRLLSFPVPQWIRYQSIGSLIRKGLQDQIVYYWFEERGVPIANEYIKKWMLFKDALFLNRTDGSLD